MQKKGVHDEMYATVEYKVKNLDVKMEMFK